MAAKHLYPHSSRIPARKLRKAHLVKRGDVSEDEVRDELEVEFGALD